MSERVRMTIDLSTRMNGEIERVAEASAISKADVIRLSIALLSEALKCKAEGMHVGAWRDSDGQRSVEREFIGL